jgi:hypothetical protein
MLVWGADANLPLSLDGVGHYFQITDPGVGGPDVRKLPFILPVGAFLWLWNESGAPYDPSVFQFVLLSGLLAISGISMYWFIARFLPRLGRASALGGALFYMFNLYALTTIWTPLSTLVFHYCLLPLVLGCFFAAFGRKSVGLAVLTAVVWSLSLTPAYVTPPILFTDALLFSAVALFFVVRERTRSERRRVLGAAALTAFVWLGLNLFWIVPLSQYLTEEYSHAFTTASAEDLFHKNSVTFDDAIRLGRYWALDSGYKNSPYFPWASYYDGWARTLGFLLPTLGVLALTRRPAAETASHCPLCGASGSLAARGARLRCEACGRQSFVYGQGDETTAYLRFFAVILLIALILITGPNPPLGDLKEHFFSRLDLAGLFRSVYQRFGGYLALAYAPLVAGGIQVLVSRAQRLVRPERARLISAAAAVIITVVVGALAWPQLSGQAYDRSGVIPSNRIEVPADYERVAGWIDRQDGDFSVLAFPFRASPTAVLSWDGGDEGYRGIEPLTLLSSKPFVATSRSGSYMDGLVRQASEGGRRAWPALRLLNVRYIVLHLDANLPYLQGQAGWIGSDVRTVDAGLAQAPELRLAVSSPRLQVYEVMPWQPFALFAVEGDPGDSLYALPFDKVKGVRYRVVDESRYIVPAGQVGPDATLVVNHPFDHFWRANGRDPVKVPPGLTGFHGVAGREVTVEHEIQERFIFLLAIVPMTLIISLSGLLLVRRLRRPDRVQRCRVAEPQ